MLSALKNFGVTFLVAGLIFGVLAFFATKLVTGTVESIFTSESERLDDIIKESENGDTEGHGVGYNDGTPVIEGDSFSFLVVTTDYRPDLYNDYILSSYEAAGFANAAPSSAIGILSGGYRSAHVSSITLVIVSKETRSFAYSYITPSLKVPSAIGYRTLSEIYYTYGIGRLEEYVSTVTGVVPDYYFVLPGDKIGKFISIAGTVQATNMSNVYSDGRYYTYSSSRQVDGYDANGQRITYPIDNEFVLYSGDLDMTADRLYTALSVLEHSKADLGTKQITVTNITEQYVRRFASLSKALLGETLTNLTTSGDIVSTDFTQRDLDSVFELFTHAEDFDAVKLTYPCTYKAATESSGEHFKPDTSKAVELFDKYTSPAYE